MRALRTTLLAIAIVAMAVALYAQDNVPSLQDLIGARGTALDSLEQRGYTYARTEKAGDSSFTYWTETETSRCVTVRTTDGKIASIVYAPATDCAGGAGASASEESFPTVCGVIVDGETYRYRCEVIETQSQKGTRLTILKYPDQEIKLRWHRNNQVGVEFEGMKVVQTSYSVSEGETDFVVEGKTYFYISDKRAARMELQDFND